MCCHNVVYVCVYVWGVRVARGGVGGVGMVVANTPITSLDNLVQSPHCRGWTSYMVSLDTEQSKAAVEQSIQVTASVKKPNWG